MSDYEETRQVGSGSGLYRRLQARLMPIVATVLFAVFSAWLAALWNDSRDHGNRITVLEIQVAGEAKSNAEFRDWIRSELQEIKGDLKELLREARK